jgi:type IV pilus assembly protein PilW
MPVASTTGPVTLTYDESASTSSKAASAGSGLYAIANCGAASVFAASAVPSATSMSVQIGGLNKTALGYTAPSANTYVTENYSYAANQTWLYRAETMAYYVRLNPNGVPSLFRTRWTAKPGVDELTADTQEMVEGVESMQLLYGQDSASVTATFPSGYIDKTSAANDLGSPAPDTANPAAAATAAQLWRRVGAVQLGLLVRGTGDRAAVDQSTTHLRVLNVDMTTPNDGQYRSTYESTIALRNRLFGN